MESRSFVNRVNDQVRKRQKRISNVAGDGEEHSLIMGKNVQNNQSSFVNTVYLTLKQMFGISAKLVGEQDEIFNVDTILWEKHSWKYLS